MITLPSKDRHHPIETQRLLASNKRAISVDESDEPAESKKEQSIKDDVIDILKLGFPIFLSSLSWVGKKTTDTALLGHVSQEALAAAALSDLWTMTSQVLLNGRILGVLVGGAIGAGNNMLAGIYLQVSYVVLFAVSIVVVVAWSLTEQVWLWYGSDAEISHMAGFYAKALSIAIPGIAPKKSCIQK
ncbi:MATE efflux family protein [Nitzschia inconspicua]|uniref:MATE efflux family protein n=1 Tax=Nitzschia inconspicua TaxID=303405 RepID=A0A9K3LT07_9STRA|nr:MATE efflux family protein [Nitzschia inconspicua]